MPLNLLLLSPQKEELLVLPLPIVPNGVWIERARLDALKVLVHSCNRWELEDWQGASVIKENALCADVLLRNYGS